MVINMSEENKNKYSEYSIVTNREKIIETLYSIVEISNKLMRDKIPKRIYIDPEKMLENAIAVYVFKGEKFPLVEIVKHDGTIIIITPEVITISRTRTVSNEIQEFNMRPLFNHVLYDEYRGIKR